VKTGSSEEGELQTARALILNAGLPRDPNARVVVEVERASVVEAIDWALDLASEGAAGDDRLARVRAFVAEGVRTWRP
jgi:hypothetical protein